MLGGSLRRRVMSNTLDCLHRFATHYLRASNRSASLLPRVPCHGSLVVAAGRRLVLGEAPALTKDGVSSLPGARAHLPVDPASLAVNGMNWCRVGPRRVEAPIHLVLERTEDTLKKQRSFASLLGNVPSRKFGWTPLNASHPHEGPTRRKRGGSARRSRRERRDSPRGHSSYTQVVACKTKSSRTASFDGGVPFEATDLAGGDGRLEPARIEAGSATRGARLQYGRRRLASASNLALAPDVPREWNSGMPSDEFRTSDPSLASTDGAQNLRSTLGSSLRPATSSARSNGPGVPLLPRSPRPPGRGLLGGEDQSSPSKVDMIQGARAFVFGTASTVSGLRRRIALPADPPQAAQKRLRLPVQ
jgi:hypothetical protein